MATALKLKNDINKLKAALRSKATPKSFLPKLKSQLEKAEADYESVKAGKKSAPKASKQVKSTMDKLKAIIKKKKYGAYRAQGVDLKKDADRPALPTGKRISKSGNTYYEYRANRIDVKQPPKRYPKLEDGGETAKFEVDDVVFHKGHNTVGIVRMGEERGEVKTDADGNVDVSELEYYNPLKHEAHKNAKVAPSTLKEIEERMLWKPFSERTSQLEKGGYMADGGTIDNSGITPADLQNQIWNLTARIAKLGDIESRAASDEIEMLMKQRKKLQSMALNHGDVVMAQGGELHRSQEEKFKYGGYMADGGEIKDQYEGREPEDIWNNLSKMQRSHFLFDHASEIEARRGEDKGELKGKEISDAMKMDFDSLDKYIRITFENHIREGQYKYGGYMAMGGALEHGLKKGDHIMVVRGNMLGIKNEITGEIVTLNIETGERKESKD